MRKQPVPAQKALPAGKGEASETEAQKETPDAADGIYENPEAASRVEAPPVSGSQRRPKAGGTKGRPRLRPPGKSTDSKRFPEIPPARTAPVIPGSDSTEVPPVSGSQRRTKAGGTKGRPRLRPPGKSTDSKCFPEIPPACTAPVIPESDSTEAPSVSGSQRRTKAGGTKNQPRPTRCARAFPAGKFAAVVSNGGFIVYNISHTHIRRAAGLGAAPQPVLLHHTVSGETHA